MLHKEYKYNEGKDYTPNGKLNKLVESYWVLHRIYPILSIL